MRATSHGYMQQIHMNKQQLREQMKVEGWSEMAIALVLGSPLVKALPET